MLELILERVGLRRRARRRAAVALALALERDVNGAEHFIIAAADTVMNRPSRELMAEVYPEVPYRPTAGDYDTLFSTRRRGPAYLPPR